MSFAREMHNMKCTIFPKIIHFRDWLHTSVWTSHLYRTMFSGLSWKQCFRSTLKFITEQWNIRKRNVVILGPCVEGNCLHYYLHHLKFPTCNYSFILHVALMKNVIHPLCRELLLLFTIMCIVFPLYSLTIIFVYNKEHFCYCYTS